MSIAGTNAITELWAKCKAYFQAKLVSGTNIKTINNESLLGSGNISVGGGSIPSGGIQGAVLAKASANDGDVTWAASVAPFKVYASSTNTSQAFCGFRDLVAADIPDLSGTYLPLTGGTVNGSVTVTGNITADSTIYAQDSHMYIKRASLDTTAANNGISADSYLYHGWLDKNSKFSGWCGNIAYTDGRIATQLAARRVNSSANLDNVLVLAVNPNGNRTVTVSDAAPWRAALDLGTAATHDNSDYASSDNVHHSTSEMGLVTDNGLSRFIVTGNRNPRVDTRAATTDNFATLGYLPLMAPSAAPNSDAMKAANLVFATPNGSNGFPTMRKLVAADITGLGNTAKGAAQSAFDSYTGNISTTSGTTKNLDTVVLAPGTWIVTYTVEFASNATGRRAMTLTTNATSITSNPTYMASGAPANGFQTNLSRTQVIVNNGTSNTTRYLNAYQNSGSALNCRSCIQAVRIA